MSDSGEAINKTTSSSLAANYTNVIYRTYSLTYIFIIKNSF